MTVKAITRTLGKVASRVEEMAPGRWRFGLDGDSAPEVEARLTDDWLLLEAVPGDGADREKPWELLRRNAELPGLAKFVLTPAASAVRLRAEIPLDGPVRTARRLERACAAFRGETRGALPAEQEVGIVALADLCEEAGWPFFERGENRGAVTLEAGGGFHQAHLQLAGSGLHARVVLAEPPDQLAGWRPALAVLLLTGAAITRLVRPVSGDGEDASEAGFEVRFEERPSAGELSWALAALSVACRLYAREAQALAEPEIAAAYLALRGPERYRTTSRRQTAAGAKKGG